MNHEKVGHIFFWSVLVFVVLVVVVSLPRCTAPAPEYQQAAPVVQGVAPMAAPMVAAPAPVIVQQGSSGEGFLTGMLMGHLLTNSANSTVAPQRSTTVINKTYNVTRPAAPTNTYRPPSRPASTYRAPSYSRSYSSPSYSRSFSSGRR